ncbi:hypothetical protein [Castellaniella ginsengisoli]|uniref:Chromosome partition protein Smc n=1 Tax=Castellaniella ginsengisoli TaxID=546114 RepID=A0AB39FPR2_9BURK
MNIKIENTLQAGTAARDAWGEVFLKLSSGEIPLDKPYDILQDCTLQELDERMTATFALIEGLRRIDEGAISLVLPRLKNIDKSIGQIKTTCESALNTAKTFPDDFTLNDPSGNLQLQVVSGGAAVATWELNGLLPTVGSQQMALLDPLTLSLRFGRYRGASFFQQTATELRALADELKGLVEESSPRADSIEKALETVRASMAAIASEEEGAVEKNKEIAVLVQESQTKVDEIDAKLARTKEITGKSDALEKEVDGYRSSFDAFQKSLDARVSAHEKFEENVRSVNIKNKEREADIDRLIGQADTMIRGATTAGLSSSLDETKLSYERKLVVTQRWFLGSAIFLLICVLPIVGQLIPGPWQQWFPSTPHNGEGASVWLSALGKIILALPATWATAFFAGNYAELFHLSREYAHKAAMAKAVDGFKREAPDYKEEIVAGVFVEISDNPGSRRSPAAATPQNPITKRVMETLLGAIKKKAEGPSQ